MAQDKQLQTRLSLIGHEKAPGVFLEVDADGHIVSPPDVAVLMAELIATNTGHPELAAEIRKAFESVREELREFNDAEQENQR